MTTYTIDRPDENSITIRPLPPGFFVWRRLAGVTNTGICIEPGEKPALLLDTSIDLQQQVESLLDRLEEHQRQPHYETVADRIKDFDVGLLLCEIIATRNPNFNALKSVALVESLAEIAKDHRISIDIVIESLSSEFFWRL